MCVNMLVTCVQLTEAAHQGTAHYVGVSQPGVILLTVPLFYLLNSVYEWQDGKSSKKQKLSARQYVDTGMAFIQRNMEDENTFPTKFG